MKHIPQELVAGKMELIDAPCPIIGNNEVLVKNLYSAISPGTESKTVIDAHKGYIAKARSGQKGLKAILKNKILIHYMHPKDKVIGYVDVTKAKKYLDGKH